MAKAGKRSTTAPQARSISAALVGKGSLRAGLIHIESRRHRTPKGIGARKKGTHEWAQAALGHLHAEGKLRPTITGPEMVQLANNRLELDPEYVAWRATKNWGSGEKVPIDAKTIYSAAKTQGIVWRKVKGRPRKLGRKVKRRPRKRGCAHPRKLGS
jgi:hypothetical protein